MANRIAHLWWLRKHTRRDVWLIQLLINGDRSHHPSTADELRTAFDDDLRRLGLSGPVEGHVGVDVEALDFTYE